MKTIFVDLFSIASVPNLILPDGVIDELTEGSGVETILLIPDNADFVSMVAAFNRPNVRVEKITKLFPRTLLQKAFVFFYSYLMFTSTTRLLATFGARADAPPAGGNRHLAPVKSFIANTFGRSKWIKTRLVPLLYKRIFNERPYAYLFDRYHPDLVFVPNIAFNPGIEFLAEAERRGIETVAMPANWDHLNKYYIPIHARRLLVQNEPMKKEAVEYHRYEPSEITVVGFPQFDVYLKDEMFLSKSEYYGRFGIPDGSKIILFISGSVYAHDEPEILLEIAGYINRGELPRDTVILIRPYVGLRSRAHEEQKYATVAKERGVFFNWEKNDQNLSNRRLYNSMLCYADVVISVFSTTAIEAAIFDKPTVVLGFDGHKNRPEHESVTRLEKLSHFKHVLDTGGVHVARDYLHLKRLLADYLKNPEHDSEKRRELVSKMCYRVDGKSSRRIVDFLIKSANAETNPA